MNIDIEKDYFIRALSCAANGDALETPSQELDWKRFFGLCKFHDVVNTVYFAIKDCENVPENVIRKFEEYFFITVAKQADEEHILKQIEARLAKLNIDLAYLKGKVIRELYPCKEMRYSSDIDILIRPENCEKVSQVMACLGFNQTFSGVNEDIYKKEPYLNIEFHKTLLSPITKVSRVYDYDFSKTRKVHDNIYKLSDNDLFIHTLVHIVQHMENGGIGVRFFLDIYLMKKNLRLDENYIKVNLEKYGLYEFYQNVIKLCSMWFSGQQGDETTLDFAQFVLNSGTYGTSASEYITYTDEKGGHPLLNRIFPPANVISFRYPIVLKKPYLLPFYRIKRLFEIKSPFGKLKAYFSSAKRNQIDMAVSTQKDLYSRIGL